MTARKIFRFVQFLLVLAAFCFGSSAIAQDIVPPPAPPGTANYIQWDGSAYRIGFGWDNPDGSITPMGRTRGGFEPDDSGPPTPYVGTGGGGGTIVTYHPLTPGTNLWLFITQISTNEVQVTLSNTIPGFPYVLEIATNLLGPWYTNQSLLATNTVSLAQPVLIDTSFQGVFFRAVQAVPGTVRWELPFITTVTGVESVPSLSPDGRTVYLTTDSNILYSIDLNTGDVNWIDSIFTPPGYSFTQSLENLASPTVLDNIIYVGSYDGNLYAIYPDGGTDWYRSLGIYDSVYSTSAIGTNGLIITGTDEAQDPRNSTAVTGLVAMNPDGSTNWFFQPQDPFYGNAGDIESSPAVGPDGTIYFMGEGSRLYAVSATGQLKWFLPVPSGDPTDTSVAIGADALYVGSTSGFVYAVNFDGSLRWVYEFPPDQVVAGSPIVGPDETVYVGSFLESSGASPILTALTNGVPAWTWTNSTFGFPAGPALGLDGTVYIGDTSGYLSAITNGAVKWSRQLPNEIVAAPTIAPDGTILVTCLDGYLRAIWGGTPLATNAQWPEFHHDSQHTGLTSLPAGPVESCAAPFVYDATNDGTHFTFNIVGEPSVLGNPTTFWNVYSSEDLSNWMQIGTNISLDIAIGSLDTSGTNAFEDTTVFGVAQRFYQLSNSNCCSQVIGFVNLTIAPGTNLIANPLDQVDDPVLLQSVVFGNGSPMNSLNDLFIYSDGWGTNQGPSQVFKWNGEGFDKDTYNDVFGPRWGAGGYTDGIMTLLPGSSMLVSNGTGHSFTTSFKGLVRNEQIFQITSKTNYLSATAPLAGAITNVTGYIPHNGDMVQLWSTNTQSYIVHTYSSGTWSGGVPMLNVGQGFVLITTTNYTWTNSWNHFVCAGP